MIFKQLVNGSPSHQSVGCPQFEAFKVRCSLFDFDNFFLAVKPFYSGILVLSMLYTHNDNKINNIKQTETIRLFTNFL